MTDYWINAAIVANKLHCRQLDESAVDDLVSRIVAKYTEGARGNCLWEFFVNDYSIRRNDGWKLAAAYPSNDDIMLVLDGQKWQGYQFESIGDLRLLLAETPRFEFYMTNHAVSYVLCWNHHDYLVGAGDCVGWLTSVEGKD